MKRMFMLLAVVAPMLAQAQLKPPENLSDVELSTYTYSYIFGTQASPYNYVFGERVVYSGIAIQLVRVPQPLHLINPWAPEAYGPSDQNLAIDPVTKRAAGLKFFAISF